MSRQDFVIERLQSGGLITNYYCTSRCRHCLYNCSPDWPKEYISAQDAETAFQTIRSLGCRAVHIGGGEPLLRPNALSAVLEAAVRSGMHIDYVETNSSWYRDPDSAEELLAGLKQKGLQTLLVSISPFHNEHIPFARVSGVMAAARSVGMQLFPWVEGFIPDLSALDAGQPHPLAEFEAHFGRDYLHQVLQRYWIHMGGRALSAFRRILPEKSLSRVLEEASSSCAAELSDTSHFHIDLYGNYVPGLCAGLAIRSQDLGTQLDASEYPVLGLLVGQGIGGLWQWAQDRHGFRPTRSGYINKCDLCTDIRTHLVQNTSAEFTELRPKEFYTGVVADGSAGR